MFKLIAIELSPQGANGTETLLKVKASDVSRRLGNENLPKMSPIVVNKVQASIEELGAQSSDLAKVQAELQASQLQVL